LRKSRDLIRALVEDGKKGLRTPEARRILAEAHRTEMEFYGISRSLNPRATFPPEYLRKLATTFGGNVDPAKDGDGSHVARNLQFELWVAAWLAAGGKPVRLGEPDLQVAYRFEWRGLAAKRVRSPRKIQVRVREAATQVRDSTGDGFIAVSLDNFAITGRVRARTPLKAGASFFELFPEAKRATRWATENAPWIRAVLWFGHLARWSRLRTSPHLELSTLTNLALLERSQKDHDFLAAYFEEHQTQFRSAW
jgi:hypothetical protein